MLRFENLTGDVSFEWLRSGAQRMIAAELEASTRTLPFPADTVRDASLAHATRLVHGYFDRRGGALHFEVEIEDTSRNKMTAAASGAGQPIAALSRIAKTLEPSAHSFSTSNEAAFEAWARGEPERAVMLDPDFGRAWLDWAQKLAAAGDSSRSLDTASRALSQTGLRSPIDRAHIEVLAATLRHDDRAQAAGLEDLAKLTPDDPAPVLALAEARMNARQFTESAQVYGRLASLDSGNSAWKNMQGYADALAGNLDAARKDFEAYGRDPSQSVNALDSLGEAYFINGKFAEAEKAFLDAYAKEPMFLNGDTLWKAAHARWLGGDLKGADQLLERYWQARLKANDPLVAWRRANWLYETGRKDQALALLKQAGQTDAARKQLAAWAAPAPVPQELSALKKLYEQADPTQDGLYRTLYAAALMRAGQKDEAKRLLARWPLPDVDNNLWQALMYPEFLALRKQLQ